VHSNAIKLRVKRSQQTHNFAISGLAKHVQ
jgi:hypothetical protein